MGGRIYIALVGRYLRGKYHAEAQRRKGRKSKIETSWRNIFLKLSFKGIKSVCHSKSYQDGKSELCLSV
jgi:hypothetical protein